MPQRDRSRESGRTTPDAAGTEQTGGTRSVGSRRAPKRVDADSESTTLMSAVTPGATSQTYTGGRRARRPSPVAQSRHTQSRPTPGALGRSAESGAPRPEVDDSTITFPAVGSLPEGRIPGARRVSDRAARGTGRTRLLAGVAALVVAALGSMSVASPGLLAGADAALAQSYVGVNGTNAVDVSRSYDRELAVQKPLQAQQKAKALADYNASVNKKNAERGDEIVKNQWVIPVVGYRLTARYGQGGGYWSSGRHTGLDFAGPSGSTLVSVAAGTVTSTGYEGAYGNRTIITLEDGTEIWYCHQSAISVDVGQQVAPGDVIGATGSTGNVTGPHLHLEVHAPGGGAVDPYAALQSHGVAP